MAYAPTHDIPAGGLPAWTQPDGSQPPVTTLAAGLDVQLLEMRGQWGHVACSNGWEGWIDATRLVARAAATPEPTPAEAPEPEPAPVATPEPAPVVEPEPEPEATATPEPVAATSETGFAPTHTVPAGGIPMWADPDPSQAALATLAPGTEVRVVDERGQWADITLANGWEGWVDATRLVAVVAPDPV
ncbi:MAG TPA: SH3 domain-containing protein, partial [Acidimicrobiia bacterium]|nr:SH3 domain-containing protein [Acidimicrobiia bacterium]